MLNKSRFPFLRKIRISFFQQIYILFFFSGFPALIYQLIWQRDLFRIFGVNIESVTIVVTAFMLGLGLGSLAGGACSRWYKRLHPLLLLGGLEFLTGLFGVFSLRIFDQVGDFILTLSLNSKALCALLLVFVPTLLMGASLPILVAYFAQRLENVGEAVGSLYFVNTLGAGCACLCSALLVFPIFGMYGAVTVAAFINFIVAIGSWTVFWLGGNHVQSIKSVVSQDKPLLTFALHRVLMLSFLTGFVSLSYEIYFFRVLNYASGGSPSTLAIILGVFLIGLAMGSRKAGQWCLLNDGDLLMRNVLKYLTVANVAGLLFLPLLYSLSSIKSYVTFVAAILMIYLFARCWSVFLPSLAHLGIASDHQTGQQVSFLYFANILGSASGSLITGFILMDHSGIVNINIYLVLLGAFSALCLSWSAICSPMLRKIQHMTVAIGLFAPLVLPVVTANIFAHICWAYSESTPPMVKVIETRSGIITVGSKNAVIGDGMYDGRLNTDLLHHDTNMIFRPFALSLFHPVPRNVLMIGLSSGAWANVIASNPLLSQEFLGLVKQHLNPQGIFYYNTTYSTRAMRTACVVFPYAKLFSNHMIVSMDPIHLDYEHWRKVLKSYKIDGVAVVDSHNPDDENKLDQFIGNIKRNKNGEERFFYSKEEILKFTDGEEIITDDNMGTEWSHSRND